MSSGQTRCMFCSTPISDANRSEEHVFPRWTHSHVAPVPPSGRFSFTTGFETSPDRPGYRGVQPVLARAKSAIVNVTTDRVCRGCNTGPLSRLDNAAKPTALRLFEAAEQAEPFRVTSEEAQTLAAWVLKIAITHLLSKDEAPLISGGACSDLVTTGRPIRASVAWIGVHDWFPPSVAHARLAIDALSTPQGSDIPPARCDLTTISMARLTFVTWVPERSGHGPPQLDLTRWSRLWPHFGRTAESPMVQLVSSDIESVVTHLAARLGVLLRDGYELPDPQFRIDYPRQPRRTRQSPGPRPA